ncbi:camphor resistance protein CrcB [Cricetibacter osteomyelitidis]|uniref:Fluoride-specific ion channel FluC n=1 Tax=Cricetibacter osteomyelitidis TaxID=1521931 RepID=A0A4R2SYT1_9PAST|nr:CrcB family protein [Cricetibacter osteomyelitidis]TCP94860.1 camphor resistance protein CrcB [Cricetibacter osteomyelitidis]
MTALFYVIGGAAIGASLRWLLGLWLNTLFAGIVFGTLAANCLGCLLMGIAMGVLLHFPQIPTEWRLFFITGFLGSLTTFSSLAGEIIDNFINEKWFNGFAVLSVHVALGLAFTALGLWLWRLAS